MTSKEATRNAVLQADLQRVEPTLRNNIAEACTFHLSYSESYMTLSFFRVFPDDKVLIEKLHVSFSLPFEHISRPTTYQDLFFILSTR